MQQVHCFACVEVAHSGRAPPELARILSGHAPALKATHEAGRRGGDSIARNAVKYAVQECASAALCVWWILLVSLDVIGVALRVARLRGFCVVM
ncbi:hypothetical protein [Edwardsiella tarda]|uniref:hypothetical protein n=1 Tax=Edwardsiella tarda TaxID=636 RepID=UPI0008FFDAE3|nr:hypothetical protein [Edwardsiella tarda]UBU95252.1 hypothetical protein AAW15_16415 [Edwardsiella tarda]